MSALKTLMGKGLGRDDEADGPKPASLGAAYLKRMYKHMQGGDFEAAFQCLERAQGVIGEPDDEEEESDEESGEGEAYS